MTPRCGPLQPVRLLGRNRCAVGSGASGLAEGADFSCLLPGPDLLDGDLRAVLLDPLLVSLGDDRASPASPLGFEEFLLPVPVFGFRGETGAGETLPHRIPHGPARMYGQIRPT
ncbi:hypothetical protein [Streptomyces sioyaensis]|uniref:hypothetical protein n=1 Tax=Streptomyces sioyaensis TaxID=67364 RepID=UPI0036E2108F